MVVSPAPTAVTVPFCTVATLALSLCQVTFWLVASSGSTVAVRVPVLPVYRESEVLSSETPVTTFANCAVTVTSLAGMVNLLS